MNDGLSPVCPECCGSGHGPCRLCDGAGVLHWLVRDPDSPTGWRFRTDESAASAADSTGAGEEVTG
jgi:hypothetical protein